MRLSPALNEFAEVIAISINHNHFCFLLLPHNIVSKVYTRFVGKQRGIKLLGRPGSSLENNTEPGVRKLG